MPATVEKRKKKKSVEPAKLAKGEERGTAATPPAV
jgi:hypothetical protein